MKTLEARIKELRKHAASDTEYQTVQAEILELEGLIKEPSQIPQIWTADVTPENLGGIMASVVWVAFWRQGISFEQNV